LAAVFCRGLFAGEARLAVLDEGVLAAWAASTGSTGPGSSLSAADLSAALFRAVFGFAGRWRQKNQLDDDGLLGGGRCFSQAAEAEDYAGGNGAVKEYGNGEGGQRRLAPAATPAAAANPSAAGPGAVKRIAVVSGPRVMD